MIRYTLVFWALLSVRAFAEPGIHFKRNDPTSARKHITTGAAIGAGGMGACLEATGHRWPLACAVGVMAATSAAYAWKESDDARRGFEGGKFSASDFAEGTGGAAIGVGFMYVLAEW